MSHNRAFSGYPPHGTGRTLGCKERHQLCVNTNNRELVVAQQGNPKRQEVDTVGAPSLSDLQYPEMMFVLQD
jgi:hypothetical protein